MEPIRPIDRDPQRVHRVERRVLDREERERREREERRRARHDGELADDGGDDDGDAPRIDVRV